MHFHLVALLPSAFYREITVLQSAFHRLAVHFHTVSQTLAVAVTVQIARYDLSAHPTGDTDFQGKHTGFVLLHTHGHVAIPRITGLLLQNNTLLVHLKVGFVGHEQVDIYVLVLHGIYITGQGRDETANVGRTTGATEPRLALMLPPALQRIGIEETAAV